MSGGNIDILLSLWAESLVAHNDSPPFINHKDMYSAIDSTPLGDVPWEHCSCKYSGEKPTGDVPSWMTADYDFWFRSPQELVMNLVSNPDFNGGFDISPLQEHDMEGNHHFQNFMLGNWVWKQAVCCASCYAFSMCNLCTGHNFSRPNNSWFHVHPNNTWERQNNCFSCYGRMNTGLSICLLGTYTTMFDVDTKMVLCF